MHGVPVGIVACRETPTVCAIAAMMVRIRDAVFVVDPDVSLVLFPVPRVAILEAAGIEPAERVVREEERPPESRPQGQLDTGPASAVDEIPPRRKPTVVDVWVDGITRCAGGEHVGDQAFVPAADLVLESPAIVGTPMPVEDAARATRVPVPLDVLPQPRHRAPQPLFHGSIAVEVLPRGEQSHAEKGGLHEIAAVILAGERYRRPRAAVEEMRPGAVITGGAAEKIQHRVEPLERLLAGDPAALDGDHQRHEREPRAAGGDELAALSLAGRTAIGREAAHRVRGLPEEPE